MSRYKILSEAEVESALVELEAWRFEAPNIVGRYEFPSFPQAAAFVTRVFLLAQKLDHHPEFFFSYNVVEFKFCTHDVGFKLTDVDIETAKQLDEIARSLQD